MATYKSNDKTIGQILSEQLKIKKISQRALGRNTGIPSTTISSYVRDISIPSIENLSKICNALNVSLDIFNPNFKKNKSLELLEKQLETKTFNQFEGILISLDLLTNNCKRGKDEYIIYDEIEDTLYTLKYSKMKDDDARKFLKKIKKQILEYVKKYGDEVCQEN